ncbi:MULTISPECIES: IclR family transcriptional regulator [Ramlibacter]|uniref:Helix-turn-helix domain-containing protein n=1 Tax=Ramlibacter pinisoli TaxID=2682844 RepID=A0A6N8IPI5_9BURK|nr:MULTISPECIES: helix-turn-helix domain-containing protein [Ramlibacter]MBA2963833.1 helix-turn-helix domain-containing protein [Ramlibacter sp. CGMCC 1.13660]MVQ28799.1 helix-turn-helix domain-containing protein [Ramlibacter pinisoli]
MELQDHVDDDLPAGADESASSIAKAVDVLALFGPSTSTLRVEHIAARLGYTRSTAYRYVRELCAAGLLASRPEGRYSLGPRIVELERLLRITDPLYQAGATVLAPLRADDCVYQLQELSREDQVLCIYKKGPDELRYEGKSYVLNRERGLPFPLFRGAGSLALLAHLSPERIRRTYLSSADQIARAGLGRSWDDFRAAMATVRKRGYALSRRADAKHLVGIAVPILLGAERRVIGSLDYVIARGDLDEAAASELASTMAAVAADIAREYERISRNTET